MHISEKTTRVFHDSKEQMNEFYPIKGEKYGYMDVMTPEQVRRYRVIDITINRYKFNPVNDTMEEDIAQYDDAIFRCIKAYLFKQGERVSWMKAEMVSDDQILARYDPDDHEPEYGSESFVFWLETEELQLE